MGINEIVSCGVTPYRNRVSTKDSQESNKGSKHNELSSKNSLLNSLINVCCSINPISLFLLVACLLSAIPTANGDALDSNEASSNPLDCGFSSDFFIGAQPCVQEDVQNFNQSIAVLNCTEWGLVIPCARTVQIALPECSSGQFETSSLQYNLDFPLVLEATSNVAQALLATVNADILAHCLDSFLSTTSTHLSPIISTQAPVQTDAPTDPTTQAPVQTDSTTNQPVQTDAPIVSSTQAPAITTRAPQSSAGTTPPDSQVPAITTRAPQSSAGTTLPDSQAPASATTPRAPQSSTGTTPPDSQAPASVTTPRAPQSSTGTTPPDSQASEQPRNNTDALESASSPNSNNRNLAFLTFLILLPISFAIYKIWPRLTNLNAKFADSLAPRVAGPN